MNPYRRPAHVGGLTDDGASRIGSLIDATSQYGRDLINKPVVNDDTSDHMSEVDAQTTLSLNRSVLLAPIIIRKNKPKELTMEMAEIPEGEEEKDSLPDAHNGYCKHNRRFSQPVHRLNAEIQESVPIAPRRNSASHTRLSSHNYVGLNPEAVKLSMKLDVLDTLNKVDMIKHRRHADASGQKYGRRMVASPLSSQFIPVLIKSKDGNMRAFSSGSSGSNRSNEEVAKIRQARVVSLIQERETYDLRKVERDRARAWVEAERARKEQAKEAAEIAEADRIMQEYEDAKREHEAREQRIAEKAVRQKQKAKEREERRKADAREYAAALEEETKKQDKALRDMIRLAAGGKKIQVIKKPKVKPASEHGSILNEADNALKDEPEPEPESERPVEEEADVPAKTMKGKKKGKQGKKSTKKSNKKPAEEPKPAPDDDAKEAEEKTKASSPAPSIASLGALDIFSICPPASVKATSLAAKGSIVGSAAGSAKAPVKAVSISSSNPVMSGALPLPTPPEIVHSAKASSKKNVPLIMPAPLHPPMAAYLSQPGYSALMPYSQSYPPQMAPVPMPVGQASGPTPMPWSNSMPYAPVAIPPPAQDPAHPASALPASNYRTPSVESVNSAGNKKSNTSKDRKAGSDRRKLDVFGFQIDGEEAKTEKSEAGMWQDWNGIDVFVRKDKRA